MAVNNKFPAQETADVATCEFKSLWSQGLLGSSGINYIFFFRLILRKISFHFRGGKRSQLRSWEIVL